MGFLSADNFSSLKISSRRPQDVFKTSSRRRGRREIVRFARQEIVTLKTSKDHKMFAGKGRGKNHLSKLSVTKI